MSAETIRVGVVGAGANTRLHHIPKLQAIDGVTIVAVVNRRPESTREAAREFGIPTCYDSWEELVDDAQIDAVVIGTWPYLHAPVTLAALEAGKHVLTEARMAATYDEARQMWAKASDSDCVTQVVPSPIGLAGDTVMRDLMAEGYVGRVLEVFVRCCAATFADPDAPLHWRQRRELSGVNMLALGIIHETLTRWVPTPVRRVLADACTFIAQRQDPASGMRVRADLPDSLRVIAEFQDGARGLYHLSGVTRFAPQTAIEIYGTDGTLIYDEGASKILGARVDEHDELTEIPIPPDRRREWTVEEDFVAAIRGERAVELTTFQDGVRYMEFTEAVFRSAVAGEPVTLPLESE